MAIQEQQVGSTGQVAEVKAPNTLPLTSTDGAIVTVSRPDDPLITAIVTPTFVTGQGGQLAIGQNIILAASGSGSYDTGSSRSVSFEIIPSAGTVTAGAITFEGSNDDANWVPVSFYDRSAPANTPLSTYSLVANTPRFFAGDVIFKKMRVRISTGVTGTTSGIQCFSLFSQQDYTPSIFMVRLSDGTNVSPTMDNAARRGFQQISDGTNSPAIKAASTSAVTADPGLVASISPNLPVPTIHTLESAATTNSTSVKASAGRITALVLTSPLVTATIRFLKLYNKASAPTVGTDIPVMTIPFQTTVTNGGSVIVPISILGLYFSTGIAYAITGASTTADTTAIGAGDVKVFMNYI